MLGPNIGFNEGVYSSIGTEIIFLGEGGELNSSDDNSIKRPSYVVIVISSVYST